MVGLADQCTADAEIGCMFAGPNCVTERKCPQYTEGYSSGGVWKYTCINSKWEPTTCIQLPPKNFAYPTSVLDTAINQPLSPFTPTVECYQCKFKVADDSVLPPGMEFDTSDGTIHGTPTTMGSWSVKLIARAEEAAVDAMFTLTINVYSYCAAVDSWPQTSPGHEAEIECSGDLVGYQTRLCTINGSWDAPDTQACLPGNPETGLIFVDIILYLANGRTEEVKRERGIGIVSGLLNYYSTLSYDAFSVHYIRTVNNVCFILICSNSSLRFRSA